MLYQHGVGGIQRPRNIVGLGRRAEDLPFGETGGLERAQGAFDPAAGGVELVGGDGEHPGRLHVPLTLLHLLVELLTLAFTNLGGGHHHQGHLLHGLALGVNELVIHRDDLQIHAVGLGHDGGPELGIRGADDEALGAVGRQAVDGIEGLLPIGDGYLDHLETEILARLVGEVPFGLEPGLLRLLDQITQLQRLGRESRICHTKGKPHRDHAFNDFVHASVSRCSINPCIHETQPLGPFL
ncbi:hypothetical protein D3C80_838170 [compost metagenome]